MNIAEAKYLVKAKIYDYVKDKDWVALSNLFKVQFDANLIVPFDKDDLNKCDREFVFILDEDLVPWSIMSLPQKGMTYTFFAFAISLNKINPSKYQNKTGFYIFKKDQTIAWKK